MESYYYSEKLIASDTQQTFKLPRLRFVRVLNYGNEDVYISFEKDIDEHSVILPVRGDLQIIADMQDIRYKVANGSSSTIYIYGLRHIKI